MSSMDSFSESERVDAYRIYKGVSEYCETYKIPRDHLLDILEDQKVIPMIRGKATEYIAAAVLKQALDPKDWVVEKLNLNPQQGKRDEDISVTFRRSGKRFSVETKNADRGSFNLGTRKYPGPHFKVKCHKSRSNLKKAGGYNDRYHAGEFDVLMCNVSNAVFKGMTYERGLPLIDDAAAVDWLKDFYGVKTDDELRRACYEDWRICLPFDIADENGYLPRMPVVQLADDSKWFSLDNLAHNLKSLLDGKAGPGDNLVVVRGSKD